MSQHDPEPSLTPAEEAVLEQFLARGLDSYRKIATPEMLEMMRSVGVDGLRTHPVMRRFIRRLAAQPVPLQSGAKPRDGSSGSGEAGGEGER